MKAKAEFPETLTQAIKYFADTDTAIHFLASIRWPDGKVCCPRCNSSNTAFLSTRKLWKCRDCQKQFSVKVGTIFEDSPLGLDKWLPAFWMIVNAKNGISSCELSRALGVTQKTAWFMLHRIRLALQNESFDKLSGEVEVDETFVGGLAKNMHEHQRGHRGTGGVGKAVVMGLLERKGRVIAKHVRNVRKHTLHDEIHKHVEVGTSLLTDSASGYAGLNSHFAHEQIDHAVCYVKDNVHTNGLENFWSLLKRTIRGTYVSVEPFHLFRYLDEQAFRFDERKNTDAGRFLIGIVGVIGRRLKYAKLIGEQTNEWPTTSGAWQTT
jgi:transposase-like protein